MKRLLLLSLLTSIGLLGCDKLSSLTGFSTGKKQSFICDVHVIKNKKNNTCIGQNFPVSIVTTDNDLFIADDEPCIWAFRDVKFKKEVDNNLRLEFGTSQADIVDKSIEHRYSFGINKVDGEMGLTEWFSKKDQMPDVNISIGGSCRKVKNVVE